MIKIENVVLPSPEQWESIVRGTRNPMNSWEKSDSYSTSLVDEETMEEKKFQFFLGDADEGLLTRLAEGGPVHGKFLRMIPVVLDITAPLYWWKEFDTYKIGTVANSCSTMHKITEKEFDISDFSAEHLTEIGKETLLATMSTMNYYRDKYLCRGEREDWWNIIQLLPTSYNQKRTIFLSYEVLANIYKYRHDHRLDEWRTLCGWIETLPYSNWIINR